MSIENNSLFLTADEVAELTGIRNGRNKRSRVQLQADWLRANLIQHVVNARGAPIVFRAQFIAHKVATPTTEPTRWVPNITRKA
ncbi:hypothetical protein GCM10007907_20880 [Chitinimonas prasina]|uniref:DUF4224 domain-containing protein n=1 Tax=Chitinimonas prasina TaxID=1434937 RepID=A0ABQ5YHZ0_9NEIS|nr:DUF4224 domain-containing protein [Chitinimonas prasina]GLR13298.1 hypothetical protein GCM10007907_20880 [Chitinimonas prasina]